MNALLHSVFDIDARTVATTCDLQAALSEMIAGRGNLDLIGHYRVTLYEETLTDESKTYSVGIRRI